MNKLLVVFKVVSLAAVGLVGAAFIVLLMLFLVMRDSLPYRTVEWLFILVLTAATTLVISGGVMLLYRVPPIFVRRYTLNDPSRLLFSLGYPHSPFLTSSFPRR